MTTWYKVHNPKFGISAYGATKDTIVKAVEVERVTSKMVQINGHKTTKRSSYENYFETRAEAAEFLTDRLRARLEHMENSAAAAHSDLALACELLGVPLEEQSTEVDHLADTFLLFSEDVPTMSAAFIMQGGAGVTIDIPEAAHYSREEARAEQRRSASLALLPLLLSDAIKSSFTVLDIHAAKRLTSKVNLDD